MGHVAGELVAVAAHEEKAIEFVVAGRVAFECVVVATEEGETAAIFAGRVASKGVGIATEECKPASPVIIGRVAP